METAHTASGGVTGSGSVRRRSRVSLKTPRHHDQPARLLDIPGCSLKAEAPDPKAPTGTVTATRVRLSSSTVRRLKPLSRRACVCVYVCDCSFRGTVKFRVSFGILESGDGDDDGDNVAWSG